MHSAQLWLVSFAEYDDRELTTEELSLALGRHEVNSGTLVWREGLANWLPLSAFEEFSGIGTSSPGFIWPSLKSDAPSPIEDEPVTVKTLRPPLPRRARAPKSVRRKERVALNGASTDRAEARVKSSEAATVEELDANDLLWLPADSEPVSSDFLGLSRPDASLIPPPINLPAADPFDSRNGRSSELEAAMALRTRMAPVPDTSVAPPPASKDSTAPSSRKAAIYLPWVLVAGLVTGGGYLLMTRDKLESPEPTRSSFPAPVEHVETQGQAAPVVNNPVVAEAKVSAEPPPSTAPAPSATIPAVASAAPPAAHEAPKPAADTAKPAVVLPKVIPVTKEPVEVAPQKHAQVDAPPPAPAPKKDPDLVAPTPNEPAATDPFDKVAALAALDEAAARASNCRKEGDPSGTAEVRVTFSTSGRATQALINGPPFAGTTTGSCIANAMRSAHVPAFSGERTTVQKRVVIN